MYRQGQIIEVNRSKFSGGPHKSQLVNKNSNYLFSSFFISLLGLTLSPSESSSVSLSATKVLIFPAISFFWFSGMFWGSISEEKWRSPIFRENPHFSKIGQKGPKNEVFGTYEKNFALVLSGNGLKRKNRSNLNFCRKPHVKKNFFGQDMAENGHFCGARKFFFRRKIFWTPACGSVLWFWSRY